MFDAIIKALFPKKKPRAAHQTEWIAALDQKVDMLLEDLYRRAEGKFSVESSDEFIPVPKFTQGSRRGKAIFCPHCGHSHTVHSFAWTALPCLSCNTSTPKNKWLMRRVK